MTTGLNRPVFFGKKSALASRQNHLASGRIKTFGNCFPDYGQMKVRGFCFGKESFFLLFLLLVLNLAWTGTAGAAPFPVTVDGRELTFDVAPILEEGRILVPLRAVFTKMGAQVDWLPKEEKAVIKKGASFIELKPGEKRGRVNGVFYPLDVPARMIEGRILLPLRFVGEALGAHVAWLGREGGVEIKTRASAFTGSVWGYYVDAKSYTSLSNNLDKVDAVLFNSYQLEENGEVKERVYFPQGMELAGAQGMGLWAMVYQSDGRCSMPSCRRKKPGKSACHSQPSANRGYRVNLDLEMVLPEDRFHRFRSLPPGGWSRQATFSLSLPAKPGRHQLVQGHDYESWAPLPTDGFNGL